MYVVACITQIHEHDLHRFSMHPADAHALETCLRLKDQYGFRVAAIAVALPHTEQLLRHALAVGADDVMRLPARGADPGDDVNLLAAAIERLAEHEEVVLVLCGQLDNDDAGVAPALAAALQFPLITRVEHIEAIDLDLLFLRVQLQREEGQEETEAPMPAVLTVTPAGTCLRYPTVPMRLAAEEANIPVVP